MSGSRTTGRASLTASARAVFERLVDAGPATRPALGLGLDLSKPTMSAAVAELDRTGLIVGQGFTRGASGRPAEVYAVAPMAGHVVGMEVAATRVRVAAHTLDGQQIVSLEHALPEPLHVVSHAVARAAAVLAEKVRDEVGTGFGPLRQAVVAAPTLQSHRGGDPVRLDGPASLADVLPDGWLLAADPAGAAGADVPAAVGDQRHIEVGIANNANCAAIAELRLGAAVGRADFAYVQVGVKIGLGLVLAGRLVEGARRGAGEIATLPFPWSDGQRPRRGALEEYLGSDALLRRARAAWRPARSGPPPATAEDLFAAASQGTGQARAIVDAHARDIGRLVSTIIAVVDPELIVLGGGVGQHPLLLPEVRRTVAELSWDTEIVGGALGDRATLLGAIHLAIDRAVARLT